LEVQEHVAWGDEVAKVWIFQCHEVHVVNGA
jgi:hypothetical protein